MWPAWTKHTQELAAKFKSAVSPHLQLIVNGAILIPHYANSTQISPASGAKSHFHDTVREHKYTPGAATAYIQEHSGQRHLWSALAEYTT